RGGGPGPASVVASATDGGPVRYARRRPTAPPPGIGDQHSPRGWKRRYRGFDVDTLLHPRSGGCAARDAARTRAGGRPSLRGARPLPPAQGPELAKEAHADLAALRRWGPPRPKGGRPAPGGRSSDLRAGDRVRHRTAAADLHVHGLRPAFRRALGRDRRRGKLAIAVLARGHGRILGRTPRTLAARQALDQRIVVGL